MFSFARNLLIRFPPEIHTSTVFETIRHISEDRLQIFSRQARIVFQQLFLRPTACQTFDNKLNRNPRSFDCRFSKQDIFIRYDFILPIHRHKNSAKSMSKTINLRFSN